MGSKSRTIKLDVVSVSADSLADANAFIANLESSLWESWRIHSWEDAVLAFGTFVTLILSLLIGVVQRAGRIQNPCGRNLRNEGRCQRTRRPD